MRTVLESTDKIQLTSLLSRLIEFPSISREKEVNRQALDWVEGQLEGLPLHIERHEFGGFSSLVAATKSLKRPKLLLQAHMDVVPGPPSLFVPRVIEGRLYGRGTSDMKFAIASFLHLFQQLGDHLSEYDMALMITTDEEIGGEHGVGALTAAGYGANVVLLPDAGKPWRVELAAKGLYHLRITSRGVSAHGARPWLGENALDQLIAFLSEVKALFPQEPCGDNLHKHSTVNIGKITGGAVHNQVPNLAEALIDIRFAPQDDLHKTLGWVDQVVARYKGQIEIDVVVSVNAYELGEANAYYQLLVDTARSFGVTMNHIASDATSDARYFVHRGIPALVVRPNGSDYHVDDEWVDLDDLARFHSIVARYAERVARVGKRRQSAQGII